MPTPTQLCNIHSVKFCDTILKLLLCNIYTKHTAKTSALKVKTQKFYTNPTKKIRELRLRACLGMRLKSIKKYLTLKKSLFEEKCIYFAKKIEITFKGSKSQKIVRTHFCQFYIHFELEPPGGWCPLREARLKNEAFFFFFLPKKCFFNLTSLFFKHNF
jgi:hypothetical protein